MTKWGYNKTDANNHMLIGSETGKNNFDILRFLFAFGVIYSHCYVLCTGKIIDTEPVSIFTNNQVDLGGTVVNLFFAISGFLIVKSFENSNSVSGYLKKRVLRICPGFYTAFILSVFFFGTLGFIDKNHLFSAFKLLVQHINFKRLPVEFIALESPKAANSFLTNPLPKNINSSLWTIHYEFICYLLVPLLVIINKKTRKWVCLIFFILSYSTLILYDFSIINIIDDTHRMVIHYPSELLRFFVFFSAGACLFYFRNIVTRHWILAILSVAILYYTSRWYLMLKIFIPIPITYLLFYIAYHPNIRFSGFAKKYDLSYGLYLYGWVIQQLILYCVGGTLAPYQLFFITAPVALFAAYLSWNLIEYPFLKKKKQLQHFSIDTPAVLSA